MSKLAALDGIEPPFSRSKRVVIAIILKSNIKMVPEFGFEPVLPCIFAVNIFMI